MSILESCSSAVMRALAEASELHQRKATPSKIAAVLHHAREVLQILEDRIARQSVEFSADVGADLAQLRGRLQSLEKDVMPTRH
jgi:hypothetical protein